MKGGESMIRVVAKFVVDINREGEFLKNAAQLVKATQEEIGFREYGLHKDARQPATYVFIETWDDAIALHEHTQTEHYKTIVPILENLTICPVQLDIYSGIIFN